MQSSNSEEEAKSSGLDKVLARYQMTGLIKLIKQIAPDEIIVSDINGKTLILSTQQLTEIHSLDIGVYKANTACVYINFLFVGNAHGVHIFDIDNNYQKIEFHNFGDGL